MTQSLPPKSLVLYADDDIDDIELITEAFKNYSQNVELVTFPDGVELLQYVKNLDPFQPRPCLFILDINMPGMNGKEALKKLRAVDEFSDIPAVIFSTSTMPADAGFARECNAGFITKPLTSDQIHHIIEEMVEHCTDEIKKQIRKGGHK
jgi:CheY-like chemotaxis protein